jgi:hypothetical protein
MDFEGDDVTDLNPTSTTFTHIYETPGAYYPTITLTDELGNSYTGSTAIVVYDRNDMDALLQAKWNGVKQALIDGDIEGALEYHHPGSREKYRKVYTLFGSSLSGAGAALGDIRMMWAHEDMALYYTTSNEDGEDYIYDVLFSRDESGIWRIEEY